MLMLWSMILLLQQQIPVSMTFHMIGVAYIPAVRLDIVMSSLSAPHSKSNTCPYCMGTKWVKITSVKYAKMETLVGEIKEGCRVASCRNWTLIYCWLLSRPGTISAPCHTCPRGILLMSSLVPTHKVNEGFSQQSFVKPNSHWGFWFK